MKSDKVSVKYPLKYVEIQEGVIFIFETNKYSLPNPSLEIEKFNDGFFLIIGKKFFIPLNSLNITSKSKIIKLYLAGSSQATPKAEIFSIITLDEKIIGRMLGIIEVL
jgi:hypothetical protein